MGVTLPVAEGEAWEVRVVEGERDEDNVGVDVITVLILGLPLPLRDALLWGLREPTAVQLACGLCDPE